MSRNRRAPRAPRPGNRRPNQRRGGQRARRTNRSGTSNILAQGALAVPSTGFGAVGRANHLTAWDAFSPTHLPLPRVTGPYCVVRTTRLFNTDHAYVQFGTFQNSPIRSGHAEHNQWTNICAVSAINSAVINMESTNSATSAMWKMPMPGIGGSVTAVPSALSVQIMNPNALQSTTGIVAAGTYKTQVDLTQIGQADGTKTFGELGNEFISFQAPRLMSAGKLALKGVQCNSYPLNMSEMANFLPISEGGDYRYLPSEGELQPLGMTPICVANPNGIDLNYLVTMEWRVRFDPSNPAVAAHRFHGHCSDDMYSKFIQHRTSLGHGCYDISDGTARTGGPARRFGGGPPRLALTQ